MRNIAFAALVLLSAGVSASCSDDAPPTKAVGDGCYIATDCTSPLVCAYQRCHAQCADGRDCPVGQQCVGSQYPKLGVCLLTDETECLRHSDCPKPLVCGRRARCEEQCKSERDCLLGQLCGQGSCYEAPPGAEAGPPPAPVPGKESDTCIHTSDCQAPLVCILGFCAAECASDRDCSAGLTCVDSICRAGSSTDAGPDGTTADGATDVAPADAPPGYGKDCSFNSDCAGNLVCRAGTCDFECKSTPDCPKGYVCATNVCFLGPDGGPIASDAGDAGPSDAKVCSSNDECDDHLWCTGIEACLGGRCGPALDTPCNSHTSCMLDKCDETAKTCSHTKIAGTDVDGDGALDVACGGTDCDDKDPLTFAGAPERCDGRDNSCNAKVDDYAVLPRGVALVSAPSASAKINGAAAWMGDKMMAFVGVGGVCGVSTPARLFAQVVDSTGVAGTEKQIGSGACTGFSMLAASGAPSFALVAWESGTRYATVVKDDATVVSNISLAGPPGGSITSHAGGVDVAWMGSSWLIGFTKSVGGTAGAVSNFGKYGFVSTTGSVDIRNVPTDDGTGTLGAPSIVKTGFNTTSLAVAWTDSTGVMMLAVLDLAGSKTAGPVTLPAGTPIAIAGTSTGYVLLYVTGTTSRYVYVSNAGALGVDAAAGVTPPRSGHGTFDALRGEGAMVIESNDGLTMLYGRKDLTDGLEHTVAFIPAAPNTLDAVSLDVVSGLLGITHYSQGDAKSRAYKAGCLP